MGGAKGYKLFSSERRYHYNNVGIIVVEKIGGKMKEHATIGVTYSENLKFRIYIYAVKAYDLRAATLLSSSIICNIKVFDH